MLLRSLFALVLAAPLAAAQTTVRLGAPTATSREEFSAVSGLVELSGSRVLVADDKENRLTIVDLTAQTARNIGRRGAGPGEFRAIGSVFARAGGGAYLSDFAQRRLLPINDDGTFGDPFLFPASILLRGADAKGTVYGDAFLPRVASGMQDSMWILRWDPRAATIDTLMKYDAMISASTGRPGDPRRVWPPLDTWVPLASGDIMVVNATTYRVQMWAGGRPSRSFTIPWQPIRVTAGDRSAYERSEGARPPGALGQPGANTQSLPARGAFVYPEAYPPFGGGGMGGQYITVALNGHAWITRLRAASDSLALYDVIDTQSGSLAARVELGPRETLVGFGKGTVYTAMRDADDIVTLRRYAYPVLPSR